MMRRSLIAIVACLVSLPALAQNPANPTVAPPVVTPIFTQNLKSAGTLGPNDLFMLAQQGVTAPFTWGLRKMPISQLMGSGAVGGLAVYNGPSSITGLLTGAGVPAALGIAPNTTGGMALFPVAAPSSIPLSIITGLGAGVQTALADDANTTGGVATFPVSVAVSGITGLGTGVQTALGVNVGSAGAPVVNGGAGGTPSSLTLTSATGLPVSTGLTGAGTGVSAMLANGVNAASGPVALNSSGFIPSIQKNGVTSGVAITAGNIGQIQSSDVPVGSPVSLTSGAPADVTSILLPAGVWQCWGSVVTNPAGSTVTLSMAAWLSTTSATLPTALENGGAFAQIAGVTTSGGNRLALPVGTNFINISSPVTLYLSTVAGFTTSTMGAFGYEACRRVA